MTALESATARALAAAQTGDLGALGEALALRERAMDGVADPRELASALEGGEIALAALRTLKQNLQAEHARLGHMREGFLLEAATARAFIDLQA